MKYDGKKTFQISNGTQGTYEFKGKIKKAGGRFDPATKTWSVELFSSDSLWAFEGRLTFTQKTAKPESQKAMEWDALHNEGAEGYNPYR